MQASLNAAGIFGHTWPRVSALLPRLLVECGLRTSRDVATWTILLALLDGGTTTLDLFELTFYSLPLAQLATAMAPPAHGGSRVFGSMFNGA